MSNHEYKPPIEILLVEDNIGDIDLVKEALREASVSCHIHIARDGVAAISFLRQADAQKPDIILLDLNLPCKDGRDVLKEVKSDLDLKRIPVIVLTSSADENDIVESYNMHANCYIQKPIDVEKFFALISLIDSFWFKSIELPTVRTPSWNRRDLESY